MSDGKQYAERDIMALDEHGGYYCRHVSAMTGERLHSKSDIAAELGHRDMMIDRLTRVLMERDQTIQQLEEELREQGEALELSDQWSD